MLRAIVVLVGTLMLLSGFAMLLSSTAIAPAIYMIGTGTLVIGTTLFERWRYRPPLSTASSWQRTGERFEDPETGQVLAVEFDPRTGERRYVPAGEGSSLAPGAAPSQPYNRQ